MKNRFRSTAIAAAMAFSLTACGGSEGTPLGPAIELTEAQADDMMDALSVIGAFEGGFGFNVHSANMLAQLRNPAVAFATVNIDESMSCPDGGTHRMQGSVTGNETTGAFSMSVAQTYTNCAGTSSTDVLWTFNSLPSITFAMNGSVNTNTGAITINGTQKGAFNVSSVIGEGSCVIDLSMSLTGDETSFSQTISGTVCGRSVSQTVEIF